jgi:hypothetical protein
MLSSDERVLHVVFVSEFWVGSILVLLILLARYISIGHRTPQELSIELWKLVRSCLDLVGFASIYMCWGGWIGV